MHYQQLVICHYFTFPFANPHCEPFHLRSLEVLQTTAMYFHSIKLESTKSANLFLDVISGALLKRNFVDVHSIQRLFVKLIEMALN